MPSVIKTEKNLRNLQLGGAGGGPKETGLLMQCDILYESLEQKKKKH